MAEPLEAARRDEGETRGGSSDGPPTIELVPVSYSDEGVLGHLVEFYVYDYSEYMGWDVDGDGVFGYRHLDHYWTEPDRHPFFIRADGHLAGFALVRSGNPHDLAEFFVMRKYRRRGIGTLAARLVFDRFPGRWEVRQLPANAAATSFWRAAIPVSFEEEVREGRPVQRFVVEG
jgi:predicted acetyltransferase